MIFLHGFDLCYRIPSWLANYFILNGWKIKKLR
jgi:hypothetical protein